MKERKANIMKIQRKLFECLSQSDIDNLSIEINSLQDFIHGSLSKNNCIDIDYAPSPYYRTRDEHPHRNKMRFTWI